MILRVKIRTFYGPQTERQKKETGNQSETAKLVLTIFYTNLQLIFRQKIIFIRLLLHSPTIFPSQQNLRSNKIRRPFHKFL